MQNKLINIKKEIETYFLSEEYINNLIETKMWSDHGTGIFDDLDVIDQFDGLFGDPDSKDFKLKEFLHHWLPMRLNYIFSEIEEELKIYDTLYRIMLVDEDDITYFQNKAEDDCMVSNFGVYWSTSESIDACNGEPNEFDNCHSIMFTTPIVFENINWIETFRSRIDFINGDTEQEIQLFPDEYISTKIASISSYETYY